MLETTIFCKKLIRSKMKHLPKNQQDMFIKLIQENPELFKIIATEIQEKVKGGMSQMDAGMEVMKKHEEELRKLV